MPVQRRFDFQLGGKGFMLMRGQYKGRAWKRTGASDAPSRRSDTDAKYGMLPDEIDHPEVWDDWSGGFGYPYRRAGENTYHWAENFDARFPRQLVHCQQMQIVTATPNWVGSGYDNVPANIAVERFYDIPCTWEANPGTGRGAVFALHTATARVGIYYPVSSGSLKMTGPGPSILLKGRAALFGSYHHLGSSPNWYRYTWDFAQGASASAMGYADGFKTVGSRLWKYSGPFVQNCASAEASSESIGGTAETANWSATIAIGTHHNRIQDMTAIEDQVVVSTRDGVYLGDQSGTFVEIMGGLNPIHEDNYRDLLVVDGRLVTQHATGIYQYQPSAMGGQITHIGPPMNHRGPMTGRVRCLAKWGPWLYGGLFTGSQSYILAGQEQVPGVYRWHTMQRFPHVVSAHRLHFDSITVTTGGDPICTRMWAATDASHPTTGTACFYFAPIPDFNGNPLMPSAQFSPNYVGSARIDFGAVDWGAPGTPKVYRGVEVWADNLASGAQWCNVYYTIDEGSRNLLGTVAKSPKDTLYFPAGEGSWVTGQSIALSLESFTASPAYTPIYRAIVLRGALRPKSVDQITAVARIADNMRDRQGAVMRSGATMLAELRAMAQSNNPVQLIDLAGATSYVSVLPPIEEVETYQEGQNEPEIAATVRMSVLDFS